MRKNHIFTLPKFSVYQTSVWRIFILILYLIFSIPYRSMIYRIFAVYLTRNHHTIYLIINLVCEKLIPLPYQNFSIPNFNMTNFHTDIVPQFRYTILKFGIPSFAVYLTFNINENRIFEFSKYYLYFIII